MLASWRLAAQSSNMHADTTLPDWNSLAGLDDNNVPLLATALLIARDEYPSLDAGLYDGMVQGHVQELRDEIDSIATCTLKMQAINRHLFDEAGFAGNHDAYYDPRNSYLNEVLERRLGNPISLAMVQMEVARRLGVPLDGVSFPGHFLVRLPIDDGVLVMDPFNRGRPLDEDELRKRARPHLGGEIPDDEALFRILDPASHRSILMRMLRNLHGVYAEQGDWGRAGQCRSITRSRSWLLQTRSSPRRATGPGPLPANASGSARLGLVARTRHRNDPVRETQLTWGQPSQSSIISKSSLVTPQSGHVHVSGMSSQRVPAAMPSSGSPAASS